MRVEQFKNRSGQWLDYHGNGNWNDLPDDERRIVYRTDDPAMSYNAIQYHVDNDDTDFNGWYIVSYDADGTSFDSVGAYETIEDAECIYLDTHDTAIMHKLIEKCGGHSVTIIRDGKRLVGWSSGKAGSGIAIADLREIFTIDR